MLLDPHNSEDMKIKFQVKNVNFPNCLVLFEIKSQSTRKLNFWGSSSYKVLYLNVVYFNQHYCSLNSLSCSSLAFCPSVVWSSWDLRMMFSISGGETGFFCQQWHLFPSSWSTVSILVLQQSLYQNPSDSFLALM